MDEGYTASIKLSFVADCLISILSLIRSFPEALRCSQRASLGLLGRHSTAYHSRKIYLPSVR